MANIVPGREQGHRVTLPGRRTGQWPDVYEFFDTFMDRMMNRWGGPSLPALGSVHFWDIDVDERENEVLVRAEMPGFEPNDLDVRLDNTVLTITAERGKETEREYRYFHRTVTLPSGMDADKVQATYRNGMLELRIPRTEEAKPKHIRIQGQEALPAAGKGQAQPQAEGTAQTTGQARN